MKITMYELLGMVKDGKAPKKIIGKNSMGKKEIYIYNDFWYIHNFENPDGEEDFYYMDNDIRKLNDEVEILEEKEIKPLTKKDIEALGYACGEIQKCFTNGWTKSLENKPLEEEKKIPDRLGIDDINTIDLFVKINEIIDYLKSKGDE